MPAMGGLFKPKKPKTPEPERQPAPDDEASKEVGRQARMDALSRRGRRSTDLADGDGMGYTGTVLG